MEPMNVGSPTSPIAGGFGGSFNQGYGARPLYNASAAGTTSLQGAANPPVTTQPAPFLPNYLLGYENSRSSLGTSSPINRLHHTPTVNSPASPIAPQAPNFTALKFGRSERQSGPPISGLSPHTTPSRPSIRNELLSNRLARTPQASPSLLHLTPGTENPLNSSVISLDNHQMALAAAESHEWVTIFGFPVSSVSLVLTQFSQIGTITDQKLPGAGNWMHIRYQTKLQAQKALSLNGKIIASNIMVGVLVCTDETVVGAGGKENTNPLLTPLGQRGGGAVATPKSQLRSLTQSFHSTPAENQVVKAAVDTPKLNDSLLAKGMQYLLGI